MEYQDFTIDLRSVAGGGFEARVVDAPLRDTPQVKFAAPIEKATLVEMAAGFDRPGSEIAKQPAPASVSPRKLGEALFSAVFQDGLAALYRRCEAHAAATKDAGLRLRLRFRRDDTESEYLAALPWEWLFDPEAALFLATDRGVAVVREIAAARPGDSLTVDSPLRILVVDAAPTTLKKLDLKLEIERMTEALGSLVECGQVELLELKKPMADELCDALLDNEIHVLHIMGHGGYHSASGNGAVYLEQRDGTDDQVDGEKLAAYLKKIESLRLVVLNACKTARYAGKLGSSLSQGVAAAVVERTRVPAVIANQYSISDQAAIGFSERLYRRIAAGAGIDEALTEARLRLRGGRSSEWATPVLFLSASNGKLFSFKKAQPSDTVKRLPRARPEITPVRLGVRSIDGWGKDMEARNDRVLDLTQHFHQVRYIQQKEWWQEKVFPELRAFLRQHVDERRPLLLDLAAHSSIAFAAGWLLEPKSGLDVRVRQRTGGEGELDWFPKDGTEPQGALWLDRPDVELNAQAPDVAVALAVSQATVAEQVQDFIERKALPVGRLLEAKIAPEPGPRSVLGGAHSLRLAQALLPRLQPRKPHERGGHVHFFCAAPNALVFYLGQLASSLGRVVLYEYPFKADDAYGRYQKSIELPPPDEVQQIPGEDW